MNIDNDRIKKFFDITNEERQKGENGNPLPPLEYWMSLSLEEQLYIYKFINEKSPKNMDFITAVIAAEWVYKSKEIIKSCNQ